ncbi:hypothetical protein EVAR_40918_1 [Eumeta japonica]|uniref:Uncharacterized protein n=1 Tax=Eumeta variegata TaxID=151549 RepID=A0A4C1X3R2_EUMVA|nr:hypothetical protein EVAR_40918_1 [Eumeta japonica]
MTTYEVRAEHKDSSEKSYDTPRKDRTLHRTRQRPPQHSSRAVSMPECDRSPRRPRANREEMQSPKVRRVEALPPFPKSRVLDWIFHERRHRIINDCRLHV